MALVISLKVPEMAWLLLSKVSKVTWLKFLNAHPQLWSWFLVAAWLTHAALRSSDGDGGGVLLIPSRS